MISEWSAELTLTEESSKALFDVLHQQDLEFINGLLDGKHGFTLQSSDGRSVELVPAPKWIPCSERLPKIGEVVLVTWEWKCKKYITTAYMVTIRGVTYWDSKLQHEYEPLNVLAWMPLPKPWKGADE